MLSNEAKTTKAYKVSPELKEKLERLAAESGLETQEAFIENLASLYELQQLKAGNGSGYSKQIEELEYHIRRPLDLFIGMIKTEAAERLQLSQRHEEVNADRAAAIFAQEQEIADLKKEAKAKAEELALLTKENESQIKISEQLEVAARDKGLLVDQYREKVDTLSGLLNDYKAAAEENKELLTKITVLTTLTDKQAVRVTNLEGDLVALDELRIEQLHQAEEKQAEALERLTDRKEVEKERELLALRTEYQGKLEKVNEDATLKLRDLYEQIRQLQQPKE